MSLLAEPNEANLYLVDHVNLLRDSLRQHTGRELVNPGLDAISAAKAIYDAPYVVVSHNAAADPVFNYGNKTALELFELTWQELTTLPSRQSAEPPNQAERARLLEAVSTQGFIDNYSGVRISKSGRRFVIKQVTVWNLIKAGNYWGQAAVYSDWSYL